MVCVVQYERLNGVVVCDVQYERLNGVWCAVREAEWSVGWCTVREGE
jgi:hypothetical protein